MSVTLKQITWTKRGSISTAYSPDGIRFAWNSGDNGRLGVYRSSDRYQTIDFFDSTPLNSSVAYTLTDSNLVSAWPTNSSFFDSNPVYRTFTSIFRRYQGTTSTERTITAGQGIWGLDGNNNTFAYSFTGTPGTTPYLTFAKSRGDGTFSSALITTAIRGTVSLSRNGLYVTLSQQRTLKVFSPPGGSFPLSGSWTPIQIGADITIPGTSNIRQQAINDSGTRLIVSTVSGTPTIYTYELVSGSWVLRDTIVSGDTEISMSGDGEIMAFRGGDFVNTYSWNSSLNKWHRTNVTNIFVDPEFLGYAGSRLDVSPDAKYMALDMWPTTNSRAIEIYRSTITTVTYDVPVITPGQSFTITQNIAFSRSLAMLNDGLNRTVTSWSATGLPTGISINSTTGQITGTSSASGQFTASITAENPDGSDTEAVQFTVQRALPVFDGAIRATAIYAGATQAMALYRGSQKLWP